jgi:hypothetical protein
VSGYRDRRSPPGGRTDYESLVTLQFEAGGIRHELVGTVFHDGKPRIVKIDGIEVEASSVRRCSTCATTIDQVSSVAWRPHSERPA